MPCFLLTFGDASRPPVGAVIVEAPSMFHARMTAVLRRLAPSVPFGEGLKLTAKMMAAIPAEEIGRMMSGAETADLILRLVQGRRPKTWLAASPAMAHHGCHSAWCGS
jgi:hypothetical protein